MSEYYENNIFDLDNPKSEIQAAFLRARLAIEALCSEIAEILTPIIAEIAAKFAEFWRSLKLFLFGAEKYRKIIHLAKYGKKARTRKKNITRLIRLLERGRYKPG